MLNHLVTILLILFLTTTLQSNHISAQPPTNPTYFIDFCRSTFGNYTTNSTYESNLKHVLSRLHNYSSSSLFNTTAVGKGQNRVHGQYYCRGDIDSRLCRDCINEAAQSILKNCSNFKAAVMWYEECTLQYGNQSMVGVEAEHPRSWWSSASTKNVSADTVTFGAVLNSTVDRIINDSAYWNGSLHFATGEGVVSPVETAYCLVQCSPDLNGTQCETCLRSAYDYVPSCCGKWAEWVFVFYPSCQLRYSAEAAFYALSNGTAAEPALPPSMQLSPSQSPLSVQPSPPPPPPPPSMVTGGAQMVHRRESMKQGVVVAALAFFMFMATA